MRRGNGKDLAGIVTVGGPVAAIAVLSVWLNHKLVTQWISQIEGALLQVQLQMGEVTEALRHINGRA